MSSPHLVTTPIARGWCHRCQNPIIIAISSGRSVKADAYQISRETAVAAIMNNRTIYTLRDRRLFEGASIDHAMVVDHRCGDQLPAMPLPETVQPCFEPPF